MGGHLAVGVKVCSAGGAAVEEHIPREKQQTAEKTAETAHAGVRRGLLSPWRTIVFTYTERRLFRSGAIRCAGRLKPMCFRYQRSPATRDRLKGCESEIRRYTRSSLRVGARVGRAAMSWRV